MKALKEKKKKKKTFLWLPLYVTSEVDTSFVLLCWVGNFLLDVFVSRATPITKRNEIRKIVLSYSLGFSLVGISCCPNRRGFLFHKSNERFQIVWSAEKQQNKENTCMYVCVWMFMLLFYTHVDLIACVLLFLHSCLVYNNLMECQARAFKSPARYILSSPLPVWIY